jgi:hypothetical protein
MTRLVTKVEVNTNDNSMDGSGQDIFVRLANGKVIQISPEFNCLNLWESEKDLAEWSLNVAEVIHFDMGGKSA